MHTFYNAFYLLFGPVALIVAGLCWAIVRMLSAVFDFANSETGQRQRTCRHGHREPAD